MDIKGAKIDMIDLVEIELDAINDRYAARPPKTDPIHALHARMEAIRMESTDKYNERVLAQIDEQSSMLERIANALESIATSLGEIEARS